jgi:multisubunit Na+/H+ antiporter MnhF subunit
MIGAGLAVAAAAAGLLALAVVSLYRLIKGPRAFDRIAAGIALSGQLVLLIVALGGLAGAGPTIWLAALAAGFAAITALIATIKLARHGQLAAALARPEATP